ncbi:cyclin-like protein [Naematelia encephala]|uniref:Cyclin-like protein n=1 Tax=Naematelia encephala TaxID=71784 RepID=A0A1Y2BDZ1_9TREE|nr:cyclin-like protein [Naematelia encephala]
MRRLADVDQQWYFSRDALDHTPSRQDGMSLDVELQRRKEVIENIRSLAFRVKLADEEIDPTSIRARPVITSAATLVHRFYMRRSFADFEARLIAPTALFLASKIEDEQVKLRHIVNSCLDKWERGATPWHPEDERSPYAQQSREHQRWERDIIAVEEIMLDTLCFDMSIPQSYSILREATLGLGEMAAETSARAVAGGVTNGHGKRKSMIDEQMVATTGWVIILQSHFPPLPVLCLPNVLAFTVFAFLVSLLDQISWSEALAAASELGDRFGLDVHFDAEQGAVGANDLKLVQECRQLFIGYMTSFIDASLMTVLPNDSTVPSHYTRRFTAHLVEIVDTHPSKDESGSLAQAPPAAPIVA